MKGSSVRAHSGVGARAPSEGFHRFKQAQPFYPHTMNVRTVSGHRNTRAEYAEFINIATSSQIHIQNTTAKPSFTSRQLQYQTITLGIVLKITLQCTQIRYFTT